MKKHKRELLIIKFKEIIKLYNDINKSYESVTKLFGSNILFDSTWELFDAYIKSISLIYGIHEDWIYWFIYENNCGKNEMPVSVNGQSIPVVDVDSFVDVLIKDCNE